MTKSIKVGENFEELLTKTILLGFLGHLCIMCICCCKRVDVFDELLTY